ncbi:MAG: glycoside hydrolase family 5 protein [Acidimicrobiales bacterium]|nr:glycoside hydrolase family 5 protein [Acidimicrobiales bacterium]
MNRRGRTVAAAVALLVAVGLPARATDRSLPLLRLHATRGAGAAVVDSARRQVLLRGVNVNQLGDYYQANASLLPTVPLTEADFASIAAIGFNSVRLIVHWSKLEPTRGFVDPAELARVHQAVAWAARHRLYVVLDMHQDAWGKSIATAPGETCPPGLDRAIGWDGAPPWATITDGMSRCRKALREASPAVAQAWQNFYVDRDGIQAELVRTWAALARSFASDPTVAGYDLLNEPNPGWAAAGPSDVALLGLFYDRALAAIRAAERSVPGGFSHIGFFEPMATWSATSVGVSPQPAFTHDPNIVFAPHLYGGSITADRSVGLDVTSVAFGFDEAGRESARYGTTFWSGEWGWFGEPATQAASVAEYGRREDAARVGGAWWDWKQACGDPHVVGVPGGKAEGVSPSLNRFACPAQQALGIPPQFMRPLGRAYPRAAPGALTALASNPDSGRLDLAGTSTPGAGPLEVWVPGPAAGGPSAAPPRVRAVAGLANVRISAIDGGWLVRADPAGPGRYVLWLGH